MDFISYMNDHNYQVHTLPLTERASTAEQALFHPSGFSGGSCSGTQLAISYNNFRH